MITHRIPLSEASADHSFEVMLYAMRHGYDKLMDKAEKIALGVSQTLAFECFTPQVYNAWVSHRIAVRADGLH